MAEDNLYEKQQKIQNDGKLINTRVINPQKEKCPNCGKLIKAVFMDYHLGDVDGIKTARILKRNWPKTYIILMSTSVKKTSVYGRYPNLINSYILKNPDFNGISKKMHFLKWMKFLRFSLKILAFIGMIFALFYFLL